jgi:magnesium chelatase accessory protein
MTGLDFGLEGADWPLRESSHFVRAGGYRWHFQDLGAGPPALLVHGAAGATHSWRGLAPLIAEHFRVISPDLPGHAFTETEGRLDASLEGHAQALAALLDALDFAPKLVIGHSAGAVILARLIADGRLNPDLFVSINGAFFPFEGFAGHIFPVMARLMHLNPLAGRLFAWTTNRAQVGKLIEGMGSHIDDFGLDLYTRLLTTPSHASGALEMVANWDLTRIPDDLRRIATPTLLMVGENDKAIRPATAERVAKFLSHAHIARMAGLGHIAHEEDPRAVADAILAAWSALAAGNALEHFPI